LPVVAETYDGYLNDVNGFHVKDEDAFHALDTAAGGPVAEGNVGGGTGMICYEFKGGSGTASRKLSAKDGGYTVGAFVQANCGLRKQLTIAGVPVGRELAAPPAIWSQDTGSIIIVIATDAPLLPHQLNRVARRASLGLARTGSVSGNGSGDLFLAFSTANHDAFNAPETAHVDMISNERINAIFEGAVEATEEAIINALVAAEPMTGQGGHSAPALPHEAVQDLLKRHLRLAN
jgi:L-aminopeptidase/D-esterase-like protein